MRSAACNIRYSGGAPMEAEDRAVEGEEMVEESVSFSVEAQLFMSAIFVVARL